MQIASNASNTGIIRTYDADRIIDQWTQNRSNGLTPSGANWFKNAINPFRDFDTANVSGWPDANRDPSIVQVIPTTVTVSAANFAPAIVSATWDLHVVATPFPNAIPVDQTVGRSGNNFTVTGTPDTGTSFQFGGVMIYAAPAGVDPLTGPRYLPIPMPSDDTLSGLGRLVGMGIEIRDVTPDIYSQGTLTCWRMPSTPSDIGTCSVMGTPNPSPADYSAFTGHAMRLFPTTPGDALKYRGSKQWKVKDGMYQVIKFSDVNNPPTFPVYKALILSKLDDNDNSFNNTDPLSLPFLEVTGPALGNGVGGTFRTYAPRAKRVFPIHTSGAILSGLSTQYSTVTLTIKWIFELFPSTDESTLLNIARPSTGYDPVAMELYSHGMQFLPIAVKVNENDTGEWFWNLVNKVATVAKPILGMIPHPIAQAGALLADKAKTVSAKQLGHPPKKKKKNNLKLTNQPSS